MTEEEARAKDDQLLSQAKLNLRIVTNAYDSELTALIEEAKADISAACDSNFDPDNPNECRLVILYCRAMFGDGDDRALNLYNSRMAVIGTRKIPER